MMKKIVLNLLIIALTACSTTPSSNPPDEPDKEDSSKITIPTGAISGVFSVSDSTQVYFSKGNLQYNITLDLWHFAEKQNQVLAVTSIANLKANSGDIDLFGWGTSGYLNKYPTMTSKTPSDYGNGALDISYTNLDWGYNVITNGGAKTNIWRTLSQPEILYLFTNRAKADSLFSFGTIDGQPGLIVLPDNWVLPTGSTITLASNILSNSEYSISKFQKVSQLDMYELNTYTENTWSILEKNGAVFLPTGGIRTGMILQEYGENNALKKAYYWTSSKGIVNNSQYAFAFGCTWRSFSIYFTSFRDSGYSVRLVQNVK